MDADASVRKDHLSPEQRKRLMQACAEVPLHPNGRAIKGSLTPIVKRFGVCRAFVSECVQKAKREAKAHEENNRHRT